MSNHQPSNLSNKAFVLTGLGIALLVAVFLSPFASSHPDGLNRVSEDLNFADKEASEAPANKLPFANVFDGYAVKGVPDAIATPLAGLAGTLLTFGIALGIGKLAVRRSDPPNSLSNSDSE